MIVLLPTPIAMVAAQSSPAAGLANLVTPHPREAMLANQAGPIDLVADLGSVQLVDTVFLGFTNLPAGTVVTVTLDGGYSAETTIAHSYRRAPRRHALHVAPAPIATRYVRLHIATAGRVAAGVLAVGQAVRIASGREQGSGRPIADGTTVERLPDGSFGIEPGATSGGYAWTMPALTDQERDRLYALVLDGGIGTSVVVAEQTQPGDGWNEALHWGLLTKLEPYARQQPGETTWAMTVQDWP